MNWIQSFYLLRSSLQWEGCSPFCHQIFKKSKILYCCSTIALTTWVCTVSFWFKKPYVAWIIYRTSFKATFWSFFWWIEKIFSYIGLFLFAFNISQKRGFQICCRLSSLPRRTLLKFYFFPLKKIKIRNIIWIEILAQKFNKK